MLDIELVDLIKDIQNKKTEFQTVLLTQYS